MTSTTLLIDGDIVIYRACAASQVTVEWEPGQFSVSADADQARQRVDAEIEDLRRELQADAILITLSDHTANWRRQMFPEYKANRGAKPASYTAVEEYVQETYPCMTCPRLEADDVMGLYSTGKKIKGKKIIVSVDKDLLGIPGFLYNPGHPERGVVEIDEDAADLWHLIQTLVGDRTDNYAGLPGCGPVGAKKILHGLKPAERWPAIVDAYAKKGLSEDDALMQARVARILRFGEYQLKTATVKLWTPRKKAA